MPIRPENRHHYGAAWREIRQAILARAKHRCEWCKRPNGVVVMVLRCGCWCGPNDGAHHQGPDCPYSDCPGPARRVKTIITIAHLNHTPGDDRPENLAALCQRCHLRYDREHHAQTRKRNNKRQGGK